LPAGLKASIRPTNSRLRLVELKSSENFSEIKSKIESKNPNVVCGKNYIYRRLKTPNDPHFSSLWGMTKIGAPSAWDSSTGSSSIKVAIIDTGILRTHPDLSANIYINMGEIPNNGIDDDLNGYVDDRFGFNTINNNSNTTDGKGHGTHVAGIVGAVGNNGVGVTGVAWSTSLIPVKVLDDNGDGTSESVAAGVDYARIIGADILNLSLGGPSSDSVLQNALQSASNAGKLLVFAAGNEGTNNNITPSFPANYSFSNSLTVAATNQSDQLASFSNYGTSTVHLSAPGVGILSTFLGNSYAPFDGTSMAAPYVAGALAILRSLGATASQSKSCILNGVTKIQGLPVISGGRLNLASAVSLCLPAGTPTASPTPTVTPTPTKNDSAIDDPTPIPIPPISFQGTLSGKSNKNLVVLRGRIFAFQNEAPVSGTQIKRNCSLKFGNVRIKYTKTITAKTKGATFKDNISITGLSPASRVSFRCRFTNPLAPQALTLSGKTR
jgi:subtilisin family serine protease